MVFGVSPNCYTTESAQAQNLRKKGQNQVSFWLKNTVIIYYFFLTFRSKKIVTKVFNTHTTHCLISSYNKKPSRKAIY